MADKVEILKLIESAQTTLGDAVALIAEDPAIGARHQGDARQIAELILRLEAIAARVDAASTERKTA